MTPTLPGNKQPSNKGKKAGLLIIFGIACLIACLSLWHVWTRPYMSPTEKQIRDTARARGWPDSKVLFLEPSAKKHKII